MVKNEKINKVTEEPSPVFCYNKYLLGKELKLKFCTK